MNNAEKKQRFSLGSLISNNLVTVIFLAFVVIGFILTENVSVSWFLTELTNRFYRNAFLVLSLIIPVICGLGMNFGITVGAISGQLAIVLVRYYDLGGLGGLGLCAILALFIASFFGWLVGLLYNHTKGQEMIASLIVGYFANGVYQFILLFLVGGVIPVAENHPMIMTNGVGVRMTVDMGTLKDSLDNVLELPFVWVLLIGAVLALAWVICTQYVFKVKPGKTRRTMGKFAFYTALCVILIAFALYSIVGPGKLGSVRDVPVAILVLIVLLIIFTQWIMTTKLGQNFRACGQDQYIAESNGINVDKTRIIATMLSTVLAAWGQLIYIQNIGTLNVYGAHNQIGFFSVAAILVGGASVSKATVGQAIFGTLLFNAMFIMSPELGQAVFGQAILGEYFRTFMVYGVIGLALGLYVWKANKAARITIEPDEVLDMPVKEALKK